MPSSLPKPTSSPTSSWSSKRRRGNNHNEFAAQLAKFDLAKAKLKPEESSEAAATAMATKLKGIDLLAMGLPPIDVNVLEALPAQL